MDTIRCKDSISNMTYYKLFSRVRGDNGSEDWEFCIGEAVTAKTKLPQDIDIDSTTVISQWINTSIDNNSVIQFSVVINFW